MAWGFGGLALGLCWFGLCRGLGAGAWLSARASALGFSFSFSLSVFSFGSVFFISLRVRARTRSPHARAHNSGTTDATDKYGHVGRIDPRARGTYIVVTCTYLRTYDFP